MMRAPAVFTARLDAFINSPGLHEEVFGAAFLVVRYKGIEDLVKATGKPEG
jgi:NADP-dependent aldehyde dehydrogenase